MEYTVKPEESLMTIAARCGVSVDNILKANPVIKKERKIYVGQEIVLPMITGRGRLSCAGGSRPSAGGGGRPASGASAAQAGGVASWAWVNAVPPTKGSARNVSRPAGGKAYNNSITIRGTAAFVTRVRSDLDTIAKTPVGAVLVGAPGVAGATSDPWRKKYKVLILAGKKCRAEPDDEVDGWMKGKHIMYDHLGLPVTYGNKGTGKGCGTKIEYNRGQALPNEPWFSNMPTPLLLAHELIHAYLYARGEADPEVKDEIRNHERQVVGLPPFESGKITENQIRAQWTPTQPKRTRYSKWKKR